LRGGRKRLRRGGTGRKRHANQEGKDDDDGTGKARSIHARGFLLDWIVGDIVYSVKV